MKSLEELEKAFPVGTWVRSQENGRFGPLLTLGMTGRVKMLHAESGVCVRLFISRVYQPCFWYKNQPAGPQLGIESGLNPIMPMTAENLAFAVGGRKKPIEKGPIIIGVMRSWLLHIARVQPGQSLEKTVMDLSYEALYYIFRDDSNATLDKWLKENDTRVRRPSLYNDMDSAVGGLGTISRPKIL